MKVQIGDCKEWRGETVMSRYKGEIVLRMDKRRSELIIRPLGVDRQMNE